MNIVLGVSGSIAAYRAADLARDLMRMGHVVRVCLTDAAQNFVTPILFETLTGQPCLMDTFDEPNTGRMAHIDWARQADLLVIAPATASTLNKIASGIGDDMLTTIALAATCPIVVAPAMNPQMYANAITQASLQILAARSTVIVEPTEGDVACGEHGQGKLAPNSQITDAVRAVLGRSQRLAGKHVVITSGPTQEPIDEVRYLSNRSSGKMGAALALAARLMGAQVTVVSGPVGVTYPQEAQVIRVRTAEQMLSATLEAAKGADLIVGAAAVADYRVEYPQSGKIRRSTEPISLNLVPNPDVIATVAATYPDQRVIGFAAEPTPELAAAEEKLVRKGLFAIAANDVSKPGIGFESDNNELVLVIRGQEPISSGQKSKLECALWLFESLG
jgi:phosphopantothenoylcysteine decarboxylase/phosphopantothenate--cysteine ligase